MPCVYVVLFQGCFRCIYGCLRWGKMASSSGIKPLLPGFHLTSTFTSSVSTASLVSPLVQLVATFLIHLVVAPLNRVFSLKCGMVNFCAAVYGAYCKGDLGVKSGGVSLGGFYI